jgi:hypothetical protein
MVPRPAVVDATREQRQAAVTAALARARSRRGAKPAEPRER